MTEAAGQLPLSLPAASRHAMGREDFIASPANAEALALVERWRDWPRPRLAICGPAGAGKTHLAHVFAASSGAEIVAAARLAEADAPRLVARGALAVEDADRLPQAAEPALFHLVNLAEAHGAPLLLTGREPPARWPTRLADLVSRLSATTAARLHPPDDALLEAVLAKGFDDRRLLVEPGLPAFLAARIERSFAAAAEIVARLDAASLAARRPITRRLAAELIG
ncbi:hypothetical protein [Rubrimonas cliftonensis]|uniref:DnaA protein n=1 Tax=Rubrimonas cliftonensis TaxID=89524 RepID=A0A1H3WPI7_9RHOB|nr:hypothetical protein [Rubrimonas cliftonensis]SDZ88108.1 hypothetical protein SAMN05444370_10220 [Rubrimonas cliftonensis]